MGGLWTGIRPEHISVASKMVSDYSGMMVQPHKVRQHTQVFVYVYAQHLFRTDNYLLPSI